MSMVINTNIQATRTHNVYSRNNDYMNAAMTRVATGMKINSAKDGASTWAISEKMRERIRANDQANQNVQNDTALLKTAQGGVSNTIDILKTLKERAINAANDSNMDSDRDRIATEVEQLLKQIDDNASKVKFNGRTLLDGTGAIDKTGGNFTPTSDGPTVVNAPATVKGNSAVYSLTSLKKSDGTAATDTTKLTDLGFKKGDVVTFSWKEDGAAATNSYTVDENSTVGDLAFTKSKLAVSYTAASTQLKDQNNVNVTGTAASSTTAGLYAVGDKTVKITDFQVAVADSDGATNKTAQAAAVFTGNQQSEGVVNTHSVLTLSDLKGASGAALSNGTLLTALEDSSGTSLGIDAGDTLYINWKENGTAATEVTFSVSEPTKTLNNLLLSITGNVKVGLGDGNAINGADTTTTAVKDYDGNAVSVPSGDIYAVGKEGVQITDFTISKTSGGATPLLSFSVLQEAGKGAPTTTNTSTTATAAADTTDLTFFIGGETGFGITASIGTMTVAKLFDDKDAGTFAKEFTTQSGAEGALKSINTALDNALNEQTKLGALEARLGYTSDNLVTMNENLEAADSTMRDSDIAKEMTQYMKYSVLAQASQYMLAQAGQNAFAVLNLLQA